MFLKVVIVALSVSLPSWATTIDLQNKTIRLNERFDSCQSTVRLEATRTEAYMTVTSGLCPLISVNGSAAAPLQTAYRMDLDATYSITLISAGQPYRHDSFIVKTYGSKQHKKPGRILIKIQNFNPIEL